MTFIHTIRVVDTKGTQCKISNSKDEEEKKTSAGRRGKLFVRISNYLFMK